MPTGVMKQLKAVRSPFRPDGQQSRLDLLDLRFPYSYTPL